MSASGQFFITGFPRSRTAWLANLFTTGASLCAHEGFLEGEDVLVEWLKAGSNRGNSDSSLGLHWARLMEEFPSARVAIIERKESDSFESLLSFFRRQGIAISRTLLLHRYDQLGAALEEVKRTPGALILPFEALNETEGVRALWVHCLPCVPFDPERVQFLQRLNVQQELFAVMPKTDP